MGIPATRFVSELVDDSGLGGWVSTQHDKVLILADSRGLQITPNPTIHCKRIATLILPLLTPSRWVGWPVQAAYSSEIEGGKERPSGGLLLLGFSDEVQKCSITLRCNFKD